MQSPKDQSLTERDELLLRAEARALLQEKRPPTIFVSFGDEPEAAVIGGVRYSPAAGESLKDFIHRIWCTFPVTGDRPRVVFLDGEDLVA